MDLFFVGLLWSFLIGFIVVGVPVFLFLFLIDR